jgi:hypothetical protein
MVTSEYRIGADGPSPSARWRCRARPRGRNLGPAPTPTRTAQTPPGLMAQLVWGIGGDATRRAGPQGAAAGGVAGWSVRNRDMARGLNTPPRIRAYPGSRGAGSPGGRPCHGLWRHAVEREVRRRGAAGGVRRARSAEWRRLRGPGTQDRAAGCSMGMRFGSLGRSVAATREVEATAPARLAPRVLASRAGARSHRVPPVRR